MKFAKQATSALIFTLMLITIPGGASAQPSETNMLCRDGQDFNVKRLGEDNRINFCEAMRDKVVLVVNTASRCGFTDQYDGLEKLYSEYKDRGLVVAGFPSNDFNQEPGSEAEIKSFCRLTYGVRFPMFAKTRVKGPSADPLFKQLAELSGQKPRWNFHKYLIDRNGSVVASYGSSTEPQSQKLVKQIEQLL